MKLSTGLLVVIFLFGCNSTLRSSPTASMTDGEAYFLNKRKWSSLKSAVGAYHMSIYSQWGLGDSRIDLTVELPSGQISSCQVTARINFSPSTVRPCELSEQQTVDSLFSEIEAALLAGDSSLKAYYDADLGFPNYLVHSGAPEMADSFGVSTIELSLMTIASASN